MILALLLAQVIVSPPVTIIVHPDECDGQVICRFMPRGGRVCTCEPDVVNLGPWDPRPSPDEWPRNYPDSPPPHWGAYPMEKREP